MMDNPTLLITAADGTPANGDIFFSPRQAFSADGTKFIFSSTASNLVAGDTNGREDFFVKDLTTGILTRIPFQGVNSSDSSFVDGASISPDGSRIIFSSAESLVAGDTNGKDDVYVMDLASGALTRLSNLVGGAAVDTERPVFSPDGTKVAFLAGGDVYLADLIHGGVTLVSAGVEQPPGSISFHGLCSTPVFSADGTKLAFHNTGDDLVADDTNGLTGDFFVKDLLTGAVTIVSTDSSGKQSSDTSSPFYSTPSFSADGTKMVFAATLKNLVPGDTNNGMDVFVKDLTTGVTTRISTDAAGHQSNNTSGSLLNTSPVFSPDGESVVFASNADNLVAEPDTNPYANGMAIYVKKLASGAIVRVGYTDSLRVAPIFSPDGSKILFEASDSNGRMQVNYVPFEAAPGTRDDSYKGGYDAALFIDAAHGVLANDTDANQDALTALLVTGPAHGTVKLNADGSFTYTPSGTFIGKETFVYHAFDGQKYSRNATVTIDVAGNIERIDTASDGSQAYYGADFYTPQFSPDGQYVLFNTGSTDLVPGDSSRYSQIMLKNLATGALTLVSNTANGLYGDNATFASFSSDGKSIVFCSGSYGTHSSSIDVVVKDIASGSFSIVSTSAGGTEGNGISFAPQFSADGKSIVFSSSSSNLVDGDTNNQADIFVKDLVHGTITRINTAAEGAQADDYSALPSFSPDGKSVVFVSNADNLVAGDINQRSDVFVKNLATGAVTLVSSSASGSIADGNSDAPVFSPDGKMVAFTSAANNLGAGNNNAIEIYFKNLATGAVTLVSSNADGEPAHGPGAASSSSLYPVFSPDGTRVAFASNATNLVPGATNSNGSIYEKNLVTGAIRLVSSDSFEAEGSNWSSRPSYSADGKKIVFFSYDSAFVAGDTNNAADIFVKDLTKFPIGDKRNNTPPVANTDGYATDEGEALHVSKAKGVLANDGDAQHDVLTAALVKGPAHGELTFGSDGSFDYTPDAGYSGSDSFTYRASDGKDTSGITKVTLTIDGNVTVRSSVSYTLNAHQTNLILTGGKAIDGTGNGRDNGLTGNGNDNVLDGRAGADLMTGGDGNDTYIVDSRGDTVRENNAAGIDLIRSSISYTLDGTLDNLWLTGSRDTNGRGNSLSNIITGNSGDNIVNGEAGRDVLTGGGGRDTFVFNAGLGRANVDTVTDFNHAADSFELDNAVFAGMKAGKLASVAFTTIPSATSTAGVDGSDRILYDKAHGDLYFDRDGSASTHDRVLFAHVDDRTSVDHADFLIV